MVFEDKEKNVHIEAGKLILGENLKYGSDIDIRVRGNMGDIAANFFYVIMMHGVYNFAKRKILGFVGAQCSGVRWP